MWLLTRWLRLVTVYFYSHIPCGMWQEPSWESLDLLEISTHTSRVGCDTVNGADNPEEWGFLLTHPVWDVTPNRTRKRPTMRKISTHTSRVGCDDIDFSGVINVLISTHTSRVGCDFPTVESWVEYLDFYSHIPCGMWQTPLVIALNRNFISTHTSRVGCDWVAGEVLPSIRISTHTSRVGCDRTPLRPWLPLKDFYSHIPCGMWRTAIVMLF